MNKKAQFVAMFSLFFILGLIAINYYLVQGTGTVVEMYYVSSFVLKNNFEIKEYLFDLNHKVRYNSFKAFRDLCEKGGFYEDCEAWSGGCKPTIINLKKNFKNYFIDYFLESEDFNIYAEIKDNKFVISGKYKEGEKIFESFNVKTKVPVEFSYILEDYDVSVFEELYNGCIDVTSCDNLKKCIVPKNKCSSDQNFIYMEYDYKKDNGFIQPKVKFKLSKPEEIF